ncbi:MAG: 3-dehydroquinate dehydratase [Myxococcaceae bacterium]|nr:3-dehydroquinate dehydratase [Myxococcaceae bacterium]
MNNRILVLHGPNLNWRQIDGLILSALDDKLKAAAESMKAELKIVQSNHEGVLVDTLYAQRDWAMAAVICPTSLGLNCYSLLEAVKLFGKPVIEVVLDPRLSAGSLLKPVVERQFVGQGAEGYLQALRQLAGKSAKTLGTPSASGPGRAVKSAEKPAEVASKTLGRRAAGVEDKKAAGAKKTMGGSRDTGEGGGGAHQTQSITRALVRQKIADRLSGKVSPAGLATWARTQWQLVQRGAPAESGQREKLEDALQTLLLSATPAAGVRDEHLIDLMAQLDGP